MAIPKKTDLTGEARKSTMVEVKKLIILTFTLNMQKYIEISTYNVAVSLQKSFWGVKFQKLT